MHDSYLLLLLVLSSNTVNSSVFSDLKENVRSLLDTSREKSQDSSKRGLNDYIQEKNQNNGKVWENSAQKDNAQKKIRGDISPSKMTATTTSKNTGRSFFRVDPVFDSLKHRRLWQNPKFKKAISSSSSAIEMRFWLEDWEEQKEDKKFKALNSSQPLTDVVNMKMARPSGIPCGDPNQHDLPLGSCMRTSDCEAEFRIHRGDSFCGRSQYVCCSIIYTSYDMYQANDMSFEHDNSQTSDSEIEKRYRDTRDEKLQKRMEWKHEKHKRKRTKALIKKKIRHSITHIISEITKYMQKAYRNTTAVRIKKTKELMDLVKKMKKQFRKDKDSIVEAHVFDIINYDLALEESLKNIQGMNEAFMSNKTYRDIIINGTVNKEELRKLQRSHPVLSLFHKSRRMGGDLKPDQTEKEELELKRESTETGIYESELWKEISETDKQGPKLETKLLYQLPEIEEEESKSKKRTSKLLDYDVEYGMLYY